MEPPNISVATLTIQQEYQPKYTQLDKFDRDPRYYQKQKEDYLLYMLAHKYSFPDKHTPIMFMLYYIDKKALVQKIEFMVVYTVSEQRIHLKIIKNFLTALNLAFQLFNMKKDPLWQLHALKQLSRPVDKYIFEFRVFAI